MPFILTAQNTMAFSFPSSCGAGAGAGAGIATAENGRTITDIEDVARTAPATHTWRDLSIPAADIEPIKAFLLDLSA